MLTVSVRIYDNVSDSSVIYYDDYPDIYAVYNYMSDHDSDDYLRDNGCDRVMCEIVRIDEDGHSYPSDVLDILNNYYGRYIR